MNIFLTNTELIKSDKTLHKQLKQLSQGSAHAQLKIFDTDLAIIAKFNKKIIGMCCISKNSPNSHFANEAEIPVPYLYNYICDQSQRSKKASVFIMNFIKDWLINNNHNNCNLDTDVNDMHALQFFKKNNFVEVDNYKAGDKEFISLTFTCLTL